MNRAVGDARVARDRASPCRWSRLRGAVPAAAPSRLRCFSSRGFRSARRPAGSTAAPTSARATATRCCWPPESCDGIVLHAVRHADALEHFLHALFALGRRHAAIGQRQLDVFIHREVADQVERLEDEADFAIADARAIGERKIRDRLPVDPVLCRRSANRAGRESRAASTCRSPTARRST